MNTCENIGVETGAQNQANSGDYTTVVHPDDDVEQQLRGDAPRERYEFEYVARTMRETFITLDRSTAETLLRHLGSRLPRIDVLLRVELPCGCVRNYLDVDGSERFLQSGDDMLPLDSEIGHDCVHGGIFIQYQGGASGRATGAGQVPDRAHP